MSSGKSGCEIFLDMRQRSCSSDFREEQEKRRADPGLDTEAGSEWQTKRAGCFSSSAQKFDARPPTPPSSATAAAAVELAVAAAATAARAPARKGR
mmetsp:Transcript_104837/g.338069  ORF Transcript_104837/g.338069 Transcript_104837/m.338069 type:complete len:96 (+) Transcript_104837:1526-1813(+)